MVSVTLQQDKNYILRQVQLDQRVELQGIFISRVIAHYHRIENPMGLIDTFIQQLQETSPDPTFFDEGYHLLADIYRALNRDNQLEILWDGRTHYEKFGEDWSEALLSWADTLAGHPHFRRAMIRGTYHLAGNPVFLQMELRKMILKHFGFKLTSRGHLRRAA